MKLLIRFMKNKDIILLIIAFSFIFAGIDTAQQYLSSIFYTHNIETLSFISLSLVYLSFAFSTLFSPFFCRKFGLKKSLFFSSIFYPLFIVSIVLKSEILIYTASVFLGFAASLLWTANGTYLTRVTDDKNRGFFTGLLFSLLPLGTTITVFIISFFVELISYTTLYFILFLISSLGVIMLLFLSDVDNIKKYKLYPRQIITKKPMLLMIPFIFSSYYIFGLMISTIPIKITSLFGLSFVGKIASIFFISLVLFPLIIGRLSDQYGVKKFAYLSLFSGAIGFVILLNSNSVILFGIGIFLVALNYASLLALSYPIISYLFEDLDSAMAVRWMVASLAVFSAVFSSNFLSFYELIIAGAIFSLFSLITLNVLFSKYFKKGNKMY